MVKEIPTQNCKYLIVADESGSLGIGLMDALSNSAPFEELKAALGIGPDSTLLCFNTEGATDPVNYREILWHGKYPSMKNGRQFSAKLLQKSLTG